jgi:Fic family protein
LNFFFEKIAISCRDTVATIDRLLEMQIQLRSKVGAASRSSKALSLIDMLFEDPAITVSQAASKLGVTYAAAKNLVDKLVDLDILIEVPDVYPKTLIAWAIIIGARPEPERRGA